jgi:hypothetical protein
MKTIYSSMGCTIRLMMRLLVLELKSSTRKAVAMQEMQPQ